MSKVRLASSMWESYTGMFGNIAFENGVSVDSLSPVDKRRIGAITRVEDVADGRQVGAAVDVRVRDTKAGEILFRPATEKVPMTSVTQDRKETKVKFTRADLEKIADSEGVKGLRVISDVLNVKAASMNGLINAILANQGKMAVIN